MLFLRCFNYLTNRSFRSAWLYFLRNDIKSLVLRDELTRLALNSDRPGISTEETGIIVSLTSHGRRIQDVFLAIESIMQGSVLPDKIILWLSDQLREVSLPVTLQRQSARGLEVRYVPDQGPYTKLLPALKAFPDARIITIDDDILYPYDTIEGLLAASRSNPTAICANYVRRISRNRKGLVSLPKWVVVKHTDDPKSHYFFEGFAGVLYPPHLFDNRLFDETVFSQISPGTDDIWFNAHAMLNNVSVIRADSHYDVFPYLEIDEVQDSSLKRINSNPHHCVNDINFCQVYQHLGLYQSLLSDL